MWAWHVDNRRAGKLWFFGFLVFLVFLKNLTTKKWSKFWFFGFFKYIENFIFLG